MSVLDVADSTAPVVAHRAPRWALWSVALLVMVIGLAALGDPATNSGSDAGAKLATVASIAEHGLDGGDLGYWAEDADPTGEHRPFTFGVRTPRGWVHATSATMPMLAALGWLAAGSLGALWPALLSVPLGALGAARLARALGAPTGASAFWVIGAASPLTYYGLDQWEHAPALAASIWAIALLLERPVGWAIVRLGLIAGLAVVLRRETAIMLTIVGLVALVERSDRRHWLQQLRWAIAGVSAGLGTLIAADLLDRRVLGRTLSAKARSQVGEASGVSIDGDSDVLLTTISQYTTTDTTYLVLSVVTLVGATLAARAWRDDDRNLGLVGTVLLVGGVVLRWRIAGAVYVPGAFAVLPIVAAVPIVAKQAGRRLALAAVAATLITLAVQDVGALAAQWGGRYLLVPAATLAIVALGGIERLALDRRGADPLRFVPVALVGSTVAIGALGLWWHVDRADQLAASRDAVFDVVGEDVVVSVHSHFPREIAVDVGDKPWLLAAGDVDAAVEVAREAAPDRRVWLLEPITCPEGHCADVDPEAVVVPRLGGETAWFLLTPQP